MSERLMLKEWRLRRLLTQKELADAIGANINTIWRIESGSTRPQIRTLRKLCEVLQVTPDQLIFGQADADENERAAA